MWHHRIVCHEHQYLWDLAYSLRIIRLHTKPSRVQLKKPMEILLIVTRSYNFHNLHHRVITTNKHIAKQMAQHDKIDLQYSTYMLKNITNKPIWYNQGPQKLWHHAHLAVNIASWDHNPEYLSSFATENLVVQEWDSPTHATAFWKEDVAEQPKMKIQSHFLAYFIQTFQWHLQ